MLRAVREAMRLRAEHGVLGVASRAQVEAIVAAVGLEIVPAFPFEGRLWGLLYDGVILVRRNLLPGTQLLVLGHELGHAVLGHERGFYHQGGAARGLAGVEAQAQVFVWTLLLGRPAPTLEGLNRQIDIGHRADLPLDFLFTVVSILTTRYPSVKGMPLLALA